MAAAMIAGLVVFYYVMFNYRGIHLSSGGSFGSPAAPHCSRHFVFIFKHDSNTLLWGVWELFSLELYYPLRELTATMQYTFTLNRSPKFIQLVKLNKLIQLVKVLL